MRTACAENLYLSQWVTTVTFHICGCGNTSWVEPYWKVWVMSPAKNWFIWFRMSACQYNLIFSAFFLHSLPKVLVSYLQCIYTHIPFSNDQTQLSGSISEERSESRTGHWCQILCSLAGTDRKVDIAPTQMVVQNSYHSLPFQTVKCILFSTFNLLGGVVYFTYEWYYQAKRQILVSINSCTLYFSFSNPAIPSYHNSYCLYWVKYHWTYLYLPYHTAD